MLAQSWFLRVSLPGPVFRPMWCCNATVRSMMHTVSMLAAWQEARLHSITQFQDEGGRGMDSWFAYLATEVVCTL